MVADLEILGWLHDSELLSIDVTMEDGERHLTLLVHGDDEMGFENWGGSVFRLVFNEVDLLELKVTGFVHGPVLFDGVDRVALSSFDERLPPEQRRPKHSYLANFIDGSWLRVACQKVTARKASP